MGGIEVLKDHLESSNLMFERDGKTLDERLIKSAERVNVRMIEALADPIVRESLFIFDPLIEDFGNYLDIPSGRILTARFDLTPPNFPENEEQPSFWRYDPYWTFKQYCSLPSLVLAHIMNGEFEKDKTGYLDTGSWPSLAAAKHLANKLGLEWHYSMARDYRVICNDVLPDMVGKDFERHLTFPQTLMEDGTPIVPDELQLAPVHEEIKVLRYLIGDTKFMANKVFLDQARFTASTSYQIGLRIGERLTEEEPDLDYVVCCVAAGSLLGVSCAIKDKYQEKGRKVPKIVVVEPSESAIQVIYNREKVDFGRRLEDSLGYSKQVRSYNSNLYFIDVSHIGKRPATVALHPKFRNRLIPGKFTDEISSVATIDADEWIKYQRYLFLEHNQDIGNTSALIGTVAARLAAQGNNVATFVFEPRFSYSEGLATNKEVYDVPWLARWETVPQKIAAMAASLPFLLAGSYVWCDSPVKLFNGFSI